MNQVWLIFYINDIETIACYADNDDAFYAQAGRPWIATSEEKAREMVSIWVATDLDHAQTEYLLDQELSEGEGEAVPFSESEWGRVPREAVFNSSASLDAKENRHILDMLNEIFSESEMCKIEWWVSREGGAINICFPHILEQDYNVVKAGEINRLADKEAKDAG